MAAVWILAHRGLERSYRPGELRPQGAQLIVVLAADAYAPVPAAPPALPGYSTYIRSRHAAWLFQQGLRLPIVVSGGPARGEGVPEDFIRVERQAASTLDSARILARQYLPAGVRRVVLVTEAHHMLRAELSFRHAGFEVAPAPCAFRAARFEWRWAYLLPNSRAIGVTEASIHEWIGLLWYRLRGAIRMEPAGN